MNGDRRTLVRYSHVFWAFLIFFLGLYFFWKSGEIPRIQPKGQLSPAFWPRVILGCLIVFSLLKGIVAFAEGGKGPSPPQVAAEAELVERKRWKLIGSILLVLAYAYLTELIGFPLANFLFLLSFMYLGGVRKPFWLVLLPLSGTIVLLYLFVKLVYVPLPRGIGAFEDLTISLYRLLGIF